MSEKNNPINRDNNVQDEEFKNMLKEVFGQKEQILNNRRKNIDASSDGKITNKNPDGKRSNIPTQQRRVPNRPNNSNARAMANGERGAAPTNRKPRPSAPSGSRPNAARPKSGVNNGPSRNKPNRNARSVNRTESKQVRNRPDNARHMNNAGNTRPVNNAGNTRSVNKVNNARPADKKTVPGKKSSSGILFRSKDGKPLTAKQKALRITAIIIAVVLVLCLIGYGIYHFYYSLFGRYSGERNNGEYLYNDSDYTSEPDTITEEELEKQLKGKATDLMKDKDVMNILLIGEDLRDTQDEERGNTDVMMMISLNKKNKTITMTSFMRDAWVNIDGYGQAKLNAAYWVDGPELLKSTLQDYYGVSIDRYVIVNFESFIEIIDALNGIDMEVTDEEAEGMKKPMAEQNNILGNKKGTDYLSKGGKLRLNGNQALAFARLRYVGNADYERTERQRRVIAEIIDESKNLSLVEIDSLLKKVLPQVKIDLTEGEVASLLLNCFDYMNYDIQQLRIPADGMFSEEIINGLSVLCPDFSANTREIIKTIYGQEALDSYNEQNPEQTGYNNYGTDYYGNDNYGYYDGGYTGY